MDVGLALLADYANVTAEGKLNILGVFNIIYASRFPTVHRQMQLVFTLEAPLWEMGSPKKVEIRLMTEDGQTLLSLSGELALHSEGGQPTGELKLPQIIQLQDLRFEKPGTYQFAILINDDTKKTIPIRVVERSEERRVGKECRL